MALDSGAQAWMVDLPRLRWTLDSLRSGLGNVPSLSAEVDPAALLHDTAALAQCVRAVLDKVDHGELTHRLAASRLATEYRDPERYRRLDATLRDLHAASQRRILGALGEARSRTAIRLLGSPIPDFLSVLGRADEENSHTDILRWLLDPSEAPAVAKATLLGLARRFDQPEVWGDKLQGAIASGTVSVRREFVYGREWESTDALDRIDLVISGPGFVIAVETKLWSAEHNEQTVSYWEWLQAVPGLRAGIFLTPTGDSASCVDFKPVSFMELLALLLDAPARGEVSQPEELVLASYLKTLGKTALKAELRILEREGR
jgi:hypothetical protein